MTNKYYWKIPEHNVTDWKICPCTYCIAERLGVTHYEAIKSALKKYAERFEQNPPFPLCDDIVRRHLW